MFFIMFYPLSVALVPTFVSVSFIFSFSVLSFGFVSVNLFAPFKLLFSCPVLFSDLSFLVFLHASVALCCVFRLSQFRPSCFVFG